MPQGQSPDAKTGKFVNVYLPRIVLGLYFAVVGAGGVFSFMFHGRPADCYADNWHSYPPAAIILLVYAILLLPLTFCYYKVMSGRLSGKAAFGMFLLVVVSGVVEFVLITMQELNNISCIPF